MEATLSFILPSALVLAALYLFYYVLLRTQHCFAFNRVYLLLAPVAALLVPLVKWPSLLSADTALAKTLQAIRLREVVISSHRPASGPGATVFSFETLLLAVYLAGAALILYRLSRQLATIRQLKAAAIPVEAADTPAQVYQLQDPLPTFAFGKAIFLTGQKKLSKAEQQQVLAHELAHVQLGHSFDIVYFELLTALQWFNPVVWLLKQELRDVHEFQADARVLRNCQLQAYRSLLSKEVLLSMGLPIGSYFGKPQVIRRLHMLQQHGRHTGWLRPLLTVPLLLGIILVFGSGQVTADILAPATATNPLKQDVKATAATPQERFNPTLPREKDAATHEETEKPYTYVEQMPEFKGGDAEMLKFLATNIRYPKVAQEAKTEGLVVLSFTVEPDGTVDAIQVLKSLGNGTDEEAMRVAGLMSGKWQPGKQGGKPVPVRYTLPLRFALK
ncbi:M56 family metallopeptidase [Pontibacter liquoris]|uniref:M56 family metallopeptidase n=1 Tax=Pontibacter liquoris TaxID=2905677 RepID=UPI001FA7862D|nr:M56 family metallopeptidase [Pontibacter liquoris]